MIVFEALVAKEPSQQSQTQRAAFRRELHDRLADFDVGIEGGDDESHGGFVMRNAPSSAAATNSLDIADGQTSGTPKIAIFSDFARGFMSGDLKLSVLSNTVYLGCVTDASFSDDKVARLLEDLRAEFSKMYQGRLSLIKKQTNLTANVYDQPFKKQFQRILDSHNTGISNKNLQLAFQKVDEVKDIAAKSVTMMVQNNAETEKLLHTS